MSVFRPFRAFRPCPQYAAKVAALPYDVVSSYEARKIAKNDPYTFLRVDRAEIEFPSGINPYDDAVYAKAAEVLNKMKHDGILLQDPVSNYYIFEQTAGGRTQTGLVGCASIDDYRNNIIKKHENTRADKEADRIHHVRACNSNTGPIFLTYPGQERITKLLASWKKNRQPVYDFVTPEKVGTKVWVVDDPTVIFTLTTLFKGVPSLYIADGHHRCASAVDVGMERREEKPDYTGEEEFNYFLAIAFPSEELRIMDYNRVAKVPAAMGKAELMQRISKNFVIECQLQLKPYRPEEPRSFGMFYDNSWYKLTARPGTFDEYDPVASLDVSILQDNLIDPVLGISDPRTDPHIDFVGGVRGLKELEKRAKSDMNIAFAMYPTSLEQLITIADAGRLMPPKSTWFEPKLLSGLFIHDLG